MWDGVGSVVGGRVGESERLRLRALGWIYVRLDWWVGRGGGGWNTYRDAGF